MSEIFERHSLEKLEQRLNRQASQMIADYIKGDITDEEHFSALLADRIALAANDLVLDMLPKPGLGFGRTSPDIGQMILTAEPFKFKGRPLKKQGQGSEERAFGADILIVLDSEDETIPFKGMLAQAKAQRGNFAYTADIGLYTQCERMYAVTQSSSFALIYAANGLFVFENPVSTGVPRLMKSQAVKLGPIVSDFVGCKRGDPAITEFSVGRFAEVASALRDRDFDAVGDLMDIDAAVSIEARPV